MTLTKNRCKYTGLLVLCVSVLLASILWGENTKRHNYKPKQGYVPNAETAIAIAVAVWIPIYGKDTIEKEKPYQAVLKKDVWLISGSLPEKNMIGGVAEAEISKENGRILRISHGK
ncbi:MAG: YbbC/YhhH family protein [Elusimicrobiota bacterium]